MRSLNKVFIIGNVTSEPEARIDENSTPVISFQVVTNRTFTTANGDRKRETEWFNVVTWGKLAGLCRRFLRKGHRIYTEGRLHSRMVGSQEGQRNYYVEVVANRILFLDRQIVQSPSKDGQENGIKDIQPT